MIDRILDPTKPPLIVAELSGNHRQDIDLARQLIDAAAKAGADAVKLQTYTPETLTLDSDRPEFVVQDGLWQGRRLHDLYAEAATPYSWHAPLARHARELGIEIFSTPFDEAAVDFLEKAVRPPLHKISSFELTHHPLLERVAQTRKPIILSTGMASQAEIAEAVSILRNNGAGPIILLKCVSAYPSQPSGFNLRSMPALGETFDCPFGLSDHSLDNAVALAATTLGARLIEKHLTHDRSGGTIDSGFSLEPHELASLVQQSRQVHAALGSPAIGPSAQDAKQTHFRRSIYAARDIKAGEAFTSDNLRIVRPSLGLAPKRWKTLLGQKAARDIPFATPLTLSDLQ